MWQNMVTYPSQLSWREYMYKQASCDFLRKMCLTYDFMTKATGTHVILGLLSEFKQLRKVGPNWRWNFTISTVMVTILVKYLMLPVYCSFITPYSSRLTIAHCSKLLDNYTNPLPPSQRPENLYTISLAACFCMTLSNYFLTLKEALLQEEIFNGPFASFQ